MGFAADSATIHPGGCHSSIRFVGSVQLHKAPTLSECAQRKWKSRSAQPLYQRVRAAHLRSACERRTKQPTKRRQEQPERGPRVVPANVSTFCVYQQIPSYLSCELLSNSRTKSTITISG